MLGGDQKLLYVRRAAGEFNWLLLENKSALITENHVVFTLLFFFFCFFSELDYKFMLINVFSFMAGKTLNAGQGACLYDFQK